MNTVGKVTVTSTLYYIPSQGICHIIVSEVDANGDSRVVNSDVIPCSNRFYFASMVRSDLHVLGEANVKSYVADEFEHHHYQGSLG